MLLTSYQNIQELERTASHIPITTLGASSLGTGSSSSRLRQLFICFENETYPHMLEEQFVFRALNTGIRFKIVGY